MKCRYKDMCRDTFGYKNSDKCSIDDAWECPIANKIEDLLMDAKFVDPETGEEVPFCDDYDGPVEEEEP